jgi:hypothetical protein
MKTVNLIKLVAAAAVAIPSIAAGAPTVRGAMGAPAEAITQRLILAMKGERLFRPSDFVEPLAESDKRTLRELRYCDVDYIGHPAAAEMDHLSAQQLVDADELVLDASRVIVRLKCNGIPEATPVGLVLHLVGGKIARVEAHNTELVKAD